MDTYKIILWYSKKQKRVEAGEGIIWKLGLNFFMIRPPFSKSNTGCLAASIMGGVMGPLYCNLELSFVKLEMD